MGMENLRQEFNQLETLSAKAEETDTYQAWLDELREKVDIAVRQIQEYLDNKN
jgi:hypothetical protein